MQLQLTRRQYENNYKMQKIQTTTKKRFFLIVFRKSYTISLIKNGTQIHQKKYVEAKIT